MMDANCLFFSPLLPNDDDGDINNDDDHNNKNNNNGNQWMKGEENTRKHEENGRVVLVTEQRAQTGATQRSHIVIKVLLTYWPQLDSFLPSFI